MHFKPLDIRGLSFRRRLFGYRAGDVRDFMKHVVEDYESYQVKESEIVVHKSKIKELQQVIETHHEQANEFQNKIAKLKAENERLQVFEVEMQELEKMKMFAQKTAENVQAEANALIKQARKEKDKIIQDAETTKMNRLLNLQIQIDELVRELEHVEKTYAEKKRGLFELESDYEALLVTKERVAKEAQLLKQEFLTLRSKLIQKYAEGLDEFIEENHLLNSSDNEESAKVMTLTSKRIG